MLYYKVIRKNETFDWVIFLHGLGGSHRVFYKQEDAFIEHFNCVFIDLFGHGNTGECLPEYSFEILAEHVIKTMDDIEIKKAHFVSISLGTIIANAVLYDYPERVKSIVQAGAVLGFNFVSISLLKFGSLLIGRVPYMLIYRLFAFIMLPKANHAASRKIFIREAKKLGKGKRDNREFTKWFHLMETVPTFYDKFFMKENNIPKLYITGEQDHLFLGLVEDLSLFDENASVYIMSDIGHICNIESYKKFNEIAIDYIKSYYEYQMIREKSYAIKIKSETDLHKKPALCKLLGGSYAH